ncbi:MAG TPA: acetyl-CoA C-acetyltransferase [Gemmatimonadales bacterium]|jgi:acetyl-CoA acetyltransferase family protein|nr:acetyl-CoA C-acetyltransferase [Gemmatimonadales bacterium]
MPTPSDIVFLTAVRTGFGSFGGALKDLSATDLGVFAARGALLRAGLESGKVDHVIFGNVIQTSADAIYLARHVALRAGCPEETPALTVNRLCGSGFEAITQAAQLIMLGHADVVLAGGTESMSQAPHVIRGARWGLRLGPPPPLEDTLWEALRDSFCDLSMAETAERLADQHTLSRVDVDAVALRSQQRAEAAWQRGAFAAELVPVEIVDRKTKQKIAWAGDEHRRPDSTAEGLARLPPYFKKDGVVTAGNASGIVDGAAALVVSSAEWARDRGVAPVGRLVTWAAAGVDPSIMGWGPVPATRKALERAGMTLGQMDLVEVNEAFAAQYLAVERELKLDPARTNVDGGAIAIGHPLGATGARITAHLLHALRQRGGRFGLGAACIGGGQGMAVIVEAFPAVEAT